MQTRSCFESVLVMIYVGDQFIADQLGEGSGTF